MRVSERCHKATGVVGSTSSWTHHHQLLIDAHILGYVTRLSSLERKINIRGAI